MPFVQPSLALRKHGNPNWFRPTLRDPAVLTQFEMQVRHLRLTEDAYAYSRELRLWCERNRNRVYVPEWLLREWGITVDADLTGVS
jgi:hypothetical protein